MNKTIKVIDLLNKIANGEEVPKHIIVNINDEYFLNKDASSIEELYRTDAGTNWTSYADVQLGYFVEIIEDKEDINIQDIEEMPEYIHIGDGRADTDVKDEVNIKINEIIRAVKQLDKTKEDK